MTRTAKLIYVEYDPDSPTATADALQTFRELVARPPLPTAAAPATEAPPPAAAPAPAEPAPAPCTCSADKLDKIDKLDKLDQAAGESAADADEDEIDQLYLETGEPIGYERAAQLHRCTPRAIKRRATIARKQGRKTLIEYGVLLHLSPPAAAPPAPDPHEARPRARNYAAINPYVIGGGKPNRGQP